MRCLGQLLALSLAISLILVTPVAIWAFHGVRTASNPETLKLVLNDQNIYRALLPSLLDSATGSGTALNFNVNSNSSGPFSNALTESDLADVPVNLLPADWLRSQIETNIDLASQWFNGNTNTLQLRADLNELSTWLTDRNTIEDLLEIIVPRLPNCTNTQMETIQTAVTDRRYSGLPACNPTNSDLRGSYTGTLVDAMARLGQNLPPQLNLGTPIDKTQIPLELKNVRAVMDQSVWFYLALGVIVLLIMVFGASTLKGAFSLGGMTLLIAGSITALSAWALIQVLQSAPSVFNPVLDELGNNVLIAGAIILGIGVGALLLSMFMPRRNHQKQKLKYNEM